MKRLIATMLAAVMAMSMMTGCGGGSSAAAPAAAPAASAESSSAQEVITIKTDTVLNEASGWYRMSVKWGELLKERSGGHMVMENYANTQLSGGNQQKGMENVINNVCQVYCNSSMLWQIFNDKLGIWAIPYFYESTDVILKDLQYGEAGKAYGQALDEIGVHFQGLAEYGPRGIATNKPLTCIDDIKDMKIRVASCALHLDGLKAIGANPMAINWSEMYTGLQQGTVDGMEAPSRVCVGNAIQDVCPYFFDCGWVMDPGVVTVNKGFYEGLSEEDRKLFDETFAEALQWEIETVQAENEEALKDLSEKYNVTVTKQTEEDRAKFVEAMQPVYDAFEESVGKEYLDLFRK